MDDRSVSQSCLSSRKVGYPFLSGRTATNPVQLLPTPCCRSTLSRLVVGRRLAQRRVAGRDGLLIGSPSSTICRRLRTAEEKGAAHSVQPFMSRRVDLQLQCAANQPFALSLSKGRVAVRQ